MRSQLESLKAQLSKQKIVNDKLIIDSMKKKMSWIRKFVYFQICLLPILAIVWFGLMFALGLSWWNFIFLVVMCCLDVYVDYRINLCAMTDEDYSKGNLVTTVTKLMKMKRNRTIHMLFAMPVVILWVVWTGIETYNNIPHAANDFHMGFVEGGMVGGAIGAIAGLGFAIYTYRKMQRTNDDVIRGINELMNEE